MAQMIPPILPDADALPLAAESATRRSTGAVIRDYVTLTKPKIISLLLVTAAGGMFLAAQGVPSLTMLAWVWIGGALASGGATPSITSWIETLTVRCTGLKAARWLETVSPPGMR